MTVWRMRLAYWITKATDTHSECVILTALPLQQWLHERGTALHCAYSAWLVLVIVCAAGIGQTSCGGGYMSLWGINGC
jgi:hypothetical protein